MPIATHPVVIALAEMLRRFEHFDSHLYDDETTEKLGLYYAARVRVLKSVMDIDGKDVVLSPGMALTAEVTTGTRRLIEYVLSPVMEHVKESGKEW
jgi:hemolysin D